MSKEDYSRREIVGKGLGSVLGLFTSRFFPIAEAPGDKSVTDFLAIARDAGRWIAESGFQTDHGFAWPVTPGRSSEATANLYSGSAGVALFFVELGLATGEAHYFELAQRAIPFLRSGLSDQMGLFTGNGGIAFVASVIGKRTDSPVALSLAEEANDRIAKWLRGEGPMAAGAPLDVIAGLAGIGMGALSKERADPDTEVAKRCGDALIAAAIEEEGALKWPLAKGESRYMPNFSHGNAGICAFLAKLSLATGEDRYLEAAKKGMEHLVRIADQTDDGFRVYHVDPGGTERFYVGWCHGPVGVAHAFYAMSEATSEAKWQDLLRRSLKSVDASGAPGRPSEGYWNNFGLCCGAAGLGEFHLGLFRATHEAPAFEKARNVAQYLVRESSAVGGRSWVHAEHRVRPTEVVAQTGWMQGAAGIGSFFLHLHLKQQGKNPQVLTPDRAF
ncbi:MAG: hypothetical protein HONBIEJF_00180 [Fimbriimonadaceae bacterium]|nr:hypothetical protein [Fimbriimonadaceae bacterium]